MSFTPRLSTTHFVPPSSSTIYFTYTPSPSLSPSSNAEQRLPRFEPQLWTNLFSPSSNSNSNFNEWEKRVMNSFYRLKHFDDEGRIEWLGNQDGNGKIHFVTSLLGPTIRPLRSEGVEGDWSEEEEGKVLIGRFSTRMNEDLSYYDLTSIVDSWKEGSEAVKGLTMEQSSFSYLVHPPNPFHPPSSSSTPLSNVSPRFISQLLLLESMPSFSSPSPPRRLIVFPFSSSGTNSSLLGSHEDEDGGKLLLRCERDDPENEEKGGVVFVQSSSSSLKSDSFDSLISLAVSIAARSALYPSSSSHTISAAVQVQEEEEEEPIQQPSKDLTLCTWNALGPDYTLSSLLRHLSRILSSSHTSERLIETLKKGGVMLDDGWQDTSPFSL
ncbi:uncharacterized protein JCM6883_000806 [Sporobolomyces salmoneus]|uniref:uncharacterized protein n=1 Tax=Sporobolomyces salmoneus TaxID=183962 RepID=UPI00317EA6F2